MTRRVCPVPEITIGKKNEIWYDLGHFGRKHDVRFIKRGREKRVSDPSGHQLFQLTVEGSVKWRPRDPAKIVITEME